MLSKLRNRFNRDENGFSLIELMVVVLILGILMAIAIPQFTKAQGSAKDASAKSDLRNSLTAAKSIAVDNAGLFYSTGTTPIAATDMSTAEPSLTFAAVGSKTAVGVVAPAGGLTIAMEKQSNSGKVFGIAADSTGVVKYCKGTAIGDCDAFADTGTRPAPGSSFLS